MRLLPAGRARRLLAALAATLLVSTVATSVSAAAAATDTLPGFTPGRAADQLRLEQQFQDAIQPDQARALSTALSSHPQLVGTKGARQSADYSVAKLREWGLDAQLSDYSVYGPRPKNIEVSMTGPQQRQLEVMEGRYPGQEHLEDAVVGYNAYSPAGDVTGDVVYANYGLPDDYDQLAEMGVDVQDKIMLVRYGESFRGVKSKVAEEHGAKGVIIYSDPADDGFNNGPVYPNGPWRPTDSIQRGSVEYIFNYPGDPLTPGEPSTDDAGRLDPEQAGNLPAIPTTPISYGQAEHLLRALDGAAAPAEWQGGLPFDYHVGAGPTEARLNLDIDYDQLPVNNVVTQIPGTTHPDEKIIIGAHYDAWTYGTADNTSGWVSAMQIAYGLSRMMETGWQPDRTIVIAGWDGEEYGLLGSTEWAEHLAPELREGAVAYLNMDGTAGQNFSASSVPAMDDVIRSVTKQVADPEQGTVYDNWQAGSAAQPTPERLGSGSDYTTFLDHLGVASADVGFSTPGGEYHSTIDDLDMVSRYLDPGFRYHSVAAKTTGLIGLRLAQADVLPMNYSGYAEAVRNYLTEVADGEIDVSPAMRAAERWQAAAQRLETTRAELTEADDPTNPAFDRLTTSLLRQERALTQPIGLAERDWYKHQVYAPGLYTGYEVQELPGVHDALASGDREQAMRYVRLLTGSLDTATRLADEAAQGA